MVAALFVSGARYRYPRHKEFHILEKWCFATMARFPRRLEPPFMKVKFAAKTRLQAGT
jgi:hypothetical protein